MAHFAIFNKETGEIENTVECPDFLINSIHLECNQACIRVDFQASPSEYIVQEYKLIKKD